MDRVRITCTGSKFVTRKDLQADSEDENEKVKPQGRRGNAEQLQAESLLAYYGEPFHRAAGPNQKADDVTKAPLSYPCTWCADDPKKPVVVRVSLSNLTTNLKTHRDGHTADGRSKTGCPGIFNLAVITDNSLSPFSV
ncbi:uncharacterized protein MELLADRAFT_113049 [Melampsora larici-populina 98AG31]|uniref:Uncharacterized protein n=1 Tax=Melampsora larici-populina (strain 98AG31 / pathotype 3-4-7) TaxID=747676 RepID=F4S8L8_MELLP|nr:uncharacterized protein MELLADRAFT_113049 [Melampsora larici-populina 98AG31]EGF99047.1 hypothetical protein MELLADRAFT_113049 [Melampsora larici-populina 98AG31]